MVVLSVDGSMLGMPVRKQRRRRQGCEPLPPLPPVAEGQFQEVKTGVLLLPSERVETSPGRRSLVRRFLVSCLGDADGIFHHLYAQLRELGWLNTADTVVVIVGDGAEWIWNRAKMFVRRCEILDFWHALEYAWPGTSPGWLTGKDRSRPTAGSIRWRKTCAPARSRMSSHD